MESVVGQWEICGRESDADNMEFEALDTLVEKQGATAGGIVCRSCAACALTARQRATDTPVGVARKFIKIYYISLCVTDFF